MRRQITGDAVKFNDSLMKEKVGAGRIKVRPLEERQRESDEMFAQAKNDLLNETASQYNNNGRIRR